MNKKHESSDEPTLPIGEAARRATSSGFLGEDLVDQLAAATEKLLHGEPLPAELAISEEKLVAPRQPAATNLDDSVFQSLEELAGDMLLVMRRLKEIEQRQSAILDLVTELKDGNANISKSVGRELDGMRRELLGDRKHLAITSVTNELLPTIDRLRTMRGSLDVLQDDRMVSQLDAVLESLSSSLRRLNCEEFEAPTGTAFDPNWMQLEGYSQSVEPGLVAECLRPGYRLGTTLLRPATVRIGAPKTTNQETTLQGADGNE